MFLGLQQPNLVASLFSKFLTSVNEGKVITKLKLQNDVRYIYRYTYLFKIPSGRLCEKCLS